MKWGSAERLQSINQYLTWCSIWRNRFNSDRTDELTYNQHFYNNSNINSYKNWDLRCFEMVGLNSTRTSHWLISLVKSKPFFLTEFKELSTTCKVFINFPKNLTLKRLNFHFRPEVGNTSFQRATSRTENKFSLGHNLEVSFQALS